MRPGFCPIAEHVAEAARKVADAQAAAQEAQQQLAKAESRVSAAEQAQTELSRKLADATAQKESAASASVIRSTQAANVDQDTDQQDLQKRWAIFTQESTFVLQLSSAHRV